ncbi:MAG: site-2 protease family protein [Clostridia bacterium]|jgi:Zn-dependent protease|nr:site-2 protease family protein [Clostridia bacterium]MCI9274691.1 site-2 protease family protein [Clostridia bacterium]
MFFSDKRYLYVILTIFIITGLMGMTQDRILSLVLTLPAVLIAITFHEFAHAFAANKLGDDTPEAQGRLNLNPLSHIDPVGFVLLLFAGFGWGKPVQINPRNFDRKYSMETGEAIVAFAGPLMNFILAIVFSFIYVAMFKFAPAFLGTQTGEIVWTIVGSTALMNVGLGLFNLIPLPPLDGSKILIRFLPYNVKRWVSEKESIFYIIFLIIWITGLAGYIITPALEFVSNGLIHIASLILRV